MELLEATFDTTRSLRYMEATWRKAESRDIRKGQLFMKLVEPLAPAEWETGFLGIRQRDRVWDKIFYQRSKLTKERSRGRTGKRKKPSCDTIQQCPGHVGRKLWEDCPSELSSVEQKGLTFDSFFFF